MDKTTKQVILDKALELFSKKGYQAVTVAAIASEVGIKAPSLYKHYKSKQDIFDAIVEEIQKRYKNQMGFMQMNGIEASQDVNMMMNISEEHLIELGKQLFLYFLHDEYTSQFRKMMTIEQFHDAHLAELYTKQYVNDPIDYQEQLFNFFIQAGTMVEADPHIVAMHFYSPMFLQILICDNHPEKESESLKLVEEHIRQFNNIYFKKRL